MSRSQGITILGSTGTIGVNTLDVISRNMSRFHVVALTANRNVDRLFEQCLQWTPAYAVMVDESAAEQLATKLRAAGLSTEVLSGIDGLERVSRLEDTDQVMAGIVGAAGLLPTLAAAEAGKRVLLANKEALVMSGEIFMDTVRRSGAELLPIDSEHNAIFQCMPEHFSGALRDSGVSKILLTGSGGPFRSYPLDKFSEITPEQACAHPNWVMGRKISVDSATMMNKGLEIIEASWLFNASLDDIQVVIHPESIIHSMVSYSDGSVLAQMGNPDMRTPIAHAMSWPDRIDSGVAQLDVFEVAQLSFEKPDYARFPCLKMAQDALAAGGAAPAILNAANEVAVEAFLENEIPFTAIPETISHCLNHMGVRSADTLENVLLADQEARETSRAYLQQRYSRSGH